MASKRKEMELALARQFGYEDYESFREGVSQGMGMAVLRRLEKELEKYPDDEAGVPGGEPVAPGGEPAAPEGPRV